MIAKVRPTVMDGCQVTMTPTAGLASMEHVAMSWISGKLTPGAQPTPTIHVETSQVWVKVPFCLILTP